MVRRGKLSGVWSGAREPWAVDNAGLPVHAPKRACEGVIGAHVARSTTCVGETWPGSDRAVAEMGKLSVDDRCVGPHYLRCRVYRTFLRGAPPVWSAWLVHRGSSVHAAA